MTLPLLSDYNVHMDTAIPMLTLGELNFQHFVPVGWYHNTFGPDFTMDWHQHRQFEIMYCSHGAFFFEYMEEKGGARHRVPVPEKHFIFVNTRYYHRITIEREDTRIYNIELYPADSFAAGESDALRKVSLSARDIFSLNQQLTDLRNKNEAFHVYYDSYNVYETIKYIVNELSADEAPQLNIIVRILILKFFLELSRCSHNNFLARSKLSYVRKAVLYMQQNSCNPLSCRTIAEHVGISEAYLQRLFKKELGEGIHTTLTKIRLGNAKAFLANTSLSHEKIAKLSGFTSREQLFYVFRSFEHCSPSEYRRTSRVRETRTYPWPQVYNLRDG